MMVLGGMPNVGPPAVVQTAMSVMSFLESVRTPHQCHRSDDGEEWKEKSGRELSKGEMRLYDTAVDTLRLYISGEKSFGPPGGVPDSSLSDGTSLDGDGVPCMSGL